MSLLQQCYALTCYTVLCKKTSGGHSRRHLNISFQYRGVPCGTSAAKLPDSLGIVSACMSPGHWRLLRIPVRRDERLVGIASSRRTLDDEPHLSGLSRPGPAHCVIEMQSLIALSPTYTSRTAPTHPPNSPPLTLPDIGCRCSWPHILHLLMRQPV